MSGFVGLVPLAELLAEACGSRQGAVQLAADIVRRGARALPRGDDNVVYAARLHLIAVGVVTDDGAPVLHRAAELVIVCEVLAASKLPSSSPPPEPRLVFSAPADAAKIADVERLDGFVLDVIRRATGSLHIGGAFWNEQGFERLEEVLLPAVTVRGVDTLIYVNSPAEVGYRGPLVRRLDSLVATGRVGVRWFSGPRPTMLHAKFVIADRQLGYLGTANLTSWGFQGHIEAGVQLTAGQSERFVVFLEQLQTAGLFLDEPQA